MCRFNCQMCGSNILLIFCCVVTCTLQVTKLLGEVEFVIVPFHNPDGYAVSIDLL